MKQSTLYARYHTDRRNTNYKKEATKAANAKNVSENACKTVKNNTEIMSALQHTHTHMHTQKHEQISHTSFLGKMITSTCGVLIDDELTVAFVYTELVCVSCDWC